MVKHRSRDGAWGLRIRPYKSGTFLALARTLTFTLLLWQLAPVLAETTGGGASAASSTFSSGPSSSGTSPGGPAPTSASAGSNLRAEPAHPVTEHTVSSPEQLPTHPGEPTFFPLYFSSGEAELRVDSEAILGYMAQSLLSAAPDGMIRVEGRSDGVERAPEGDSRDGRLALSRARAENVKDYLVKKGLPETRFIVVGLGSSAPVGSIEGERDRERNRVVTIRLVRPTSQSALPGRVEMASPVERTALMETPGANTSPSSGSSDATGGASPAGPTTGSLAGSGTGSGSSTGSPPRAPLVEPEPIKKPVEVIVIREREKPRGPAAVETVQLSLRVVKREGPGSSGRGRWPINEHLQQEMPTLERLFRSGLSRERALVGETLVALQLDASGTVTRAEVTLPYPEETFEAELSRYFLSWQLPPPPGNDQMLFVFALTVNATFQPFISPPR